MSRAVDRPAQQLEKVFVVDVEATSRTPMTGWMTEFALSHVTSGETFYAHLYDFTPHPDTPALPVIAIDDGGHPVQNAFTIDYLPSDHSGASFADSVRPAIAADSSAEVVDRLATWTAEHAGPGRPILLSDNIFFDGMWLNCLLDTENSPPLFGYSGRRIGDFYAGIHHDFWNSNEWKKIAVGVRHTHYPADDAYANVLKFRKILSVTDSSGVGTLFE